MAKGSVYEGKSFDEAVQKGLADLRLARAEATITVVEEGKSGFLGFGARPYKVSIMRRPGGPVREPEETKERRVQSSRRDDRRGGRGGRDRDDKGGRDKDKDKDGDRVRTPREDRGGRENRPQEVAAGAKADAPRAERPARGERPDRGPRRERPERGERTDRPERADRLERTERTERSDRPERAPRPPQAEVAPAAPAAASAQGGDAGKGDEAGDARRRRRRGRRGGRGRRRGPGAEGGAPHAAGAVNAPEAPFDDSFEGGDEFEVNESFENVAQPVESFAEAAPAAAASSTSAFASIGREAPEEPAVNLDPAERERVRESRREARREARRGGEMGGREEREQRMMQEMAAAAQAPPEPLPPLAAPVATAVHASPHASPQEAPLPAYVPPAPREARESLPNRAPREERPRREHSSAPEMDTQQLAETSKRITEELLGAMGFEATVAVTAENDRVDVTVEAGQDDELLNGSKGETRQAIQQLLNRFLNKGEGSRYHLQLEINDFWQQREKELETMAHTMAEQAIATNSEQVTDYLNSQERRIVHVTLKPDSRVKTYALGNGMIKRVAIAPADFPERTGEDD